MSKNALFNLINARKSLEHFKVPDHVHLLKRTDRLGTDYFLFELPLEDDPVIGEYRLTSHHLSVYAAPISKLDYKSQYHYTAYFEKGGNQYRLHVYFDSRDYYFTYPAFAEILAENEFKPINCREHDAAFTLLADTATRELIATLRESQALVLKSLETQYDELEARILVLSQNIQLNKPAYLSTLQQQIECLKQIALYSNNPSLIDRKINWLRITETNIESMVFPNERDEEATSSEEDSKAEKIERKSTKAKKGTGYQATHFKSHAAKKSLTTEVGHKECFSTLIQQLNSRAVQCQSVSDEILVNQVEKLYLDALGLEWVLETKHHYEVTLKDLNDISVLQNKIKRLGIGLLQRTLIREHYESAAKLTSFYKMLPESIVLFSLQNYNDKLLDFLLKNQIFPHNFRNFTLGKVEYPSIVDYCFRNSTTEVRTLNCLDILVKNGISLLDVESSSGLPFAAILLLSPSHPLREVLEHNADLTINNPLFYKQLNQVLRLISAKSTCSSDRRVEINTLITSNLRKIELLKNHIHVSESENVPHYLEEMLGEQMIKQLRDDPQIRYYQSSIEERATLLIRKLPRIHHKAILGLTHVNFELIGNSLNRIQNFAQAPSFDEIQRDVVKQQILILELFDLRDEFVDKEALLDGVIRHQRKPTRDQKKIIARVKEISKRIGEIQDLIVVPENDSKQAMQDKSANALLDIAKAIKGVNQFFSVAAKASSESGSSSSTVDVSQTFIAFWGAIESTRPDQSSSSSDDDNDQNNNCRIS
ncbi:hypothetical protein [Legionella quateirensis]|uniref:Coiled-coil-containing protein n=1 Tax=Legionella quateirensis TaxID=45072 RepID=A0A378KTU3_9GAMM|nr:hypothetical protein [Legionella quateirensis]KTD43362.1 coiled-coil-containing protein [Legionella quateirensis]STY18244.1 coiled-coil-containing protein [Legionella quateirensis]